MENLLSLILLLGVPAVGILFSAAVFDLYLRVAYGISLKEFEEDED